MHCEILAGQLGDGRKRALLSCPPLKGAAEDFHTVETDLLLVPVKGHRLTTCVWGWSAPAPTSASSSLACFPCFNRCMRDISSSAPTGKNFLSGFDLPLVGAAHFSPCHWLVAPAPPGRGRCSCKKLDLNGPSQHRCHCRSTTAGWLLPLLLSLSR